MAARRPASKDVRRKRRKLWKEQDKRCFWCEKPVVLPEDLLRSYLPMDDIYNLGMTDQINDLIEQLKAKVPDFRVVWNTQLATVDHIVEHAEGGTYSYENLVVACMPCNAERGRIYSDSLD